jgi:hypothetical protein
MRLMMTQMVRCPSNCLYAVLVPQFSSIPGRLISLRPREPAKRVPVALWLQALPVRLEPQDWLLLPPLNVPPAARIHRQFVPLQVAVALVVLAPGAREEAGSSPCCSCC